MEADCGKGGGGGRYGISNKLCMTTGFTRLIYNLNSGGGFVGYHKGWNLYSGGGFVGYHKGWAYRTNPPSIAQVLHQPRPRSPVPGCVI